MSTTDYVQLAELARHVGTDTTIDSELLQFACTAASRSIDARCGRFFYQATSQTGYTFPSTAWICRFDDFDIATTAGLTVTTDTTNDGTYATTWTVNTDYQAGPESGIVAGKTGWPITTLRAVGTKSWPIRYIETQRPTVRVVGTFGWPSVPAPIKEATYLLAAEQYKLKDAPTGIIGYGEYGAVRIRENPKIENLVLPFVKYGAAGIA